MDKLIKEIERIKGLAENKKLLCPNDLNEAWIEASACVDMANELLSYASLLQAEPTKLIQVIQDLEYCYNNHANDFLGTGSNGAAADKEELEWIGKFQNALSILKSISQLQAEQGEQ